MTTPAVELLGIARSFPGVAALAGVDLALMPGRIHALVGENGAGKSTLLNVLAGLLAPDEGEVRVGGRAVRFADAREAWKAGVVTVHQEVDLFSDLSVLENVGWHEGLPAGPLGWIDWREQRRRTTDALRAVDDPVGPDVLAAALTPAQRQLVEIAAALARQPRVLVLDEPTSSLSAAEAARLFGHLRRLREGGAAVVYVSHRLEEVFALADDVTVLRDGRRVWTGEVSATTPGELIKHMVGRAVGHSRRESGASAGPVRLRCQALSGADGAFRDVTLQVRGGEVLGLYGLVGAGRSEWAQALFGLRPIASGEVRVDDRLVTPRSPGQMAEQGVAYVPEDRARQGLCRGLSVRLNAVLASLRRLAVALLVPPGRERGLAKEWVERLGVRFTSQEQPIGTLSGGNQQKVVLGRWLARAPAVLVLDEPTRGVDVGAREEIYALIRQQAAAGRAVVLISSDLPEVMGQSDRVGVFRNGRLVGVRPATEMSAEEAARLAFPVAGEELRPRGGMARRRWALPQGMGLALFVAAYFAALAGVLGPDVMLSGLPGLLTNAALLGFCAAGAMVVLLAGGLDISLGALMCLAAAVAGTMWEQGQPFALVALAAVVAGAAGGMINAGLSLLGGVHPIVITLGTMSVYRGLAQWYLGGEVKVPHESRAWLTGGAMGVPLLAWLWLALLVIAWLWLTRFTSGRELYAVGSNAAAARRVGVSRGWAWLRAFAVGGAVVGLAGVLHIGDSGGLQSTDFEGRTLDAIAAAVVGGVAITGGRGAVWGVALGCLFLASLRTLCTHLRLPTVWEQALVGSVLLAAVLVDRLGRRGAA